MVTMEPVVSGGIMESGAGSAPLAPEDPLRAAARRVLVVDDDPEILHKVIEVLRSDSALFRPQGVGSAEAALRILAAENDIDCLLTDVVLPGMDGLQLLLSARKLRPQLKVVVMTSEPTDDLNRAVLEGGGTRLLSKPLDLEDLPASVAADHQGGLSHLEGDLDLLDVCRLSAACQPEGAVRVWHGGREALLAHDGTTFTHVAGDSATGEQALSSLLDGDQWQFSSLSSLRTARLAANCKIEMAVDGAHREGARAHGILRDLTLRHLIEWAMQGRQTCTLSVTSHRRTGILSFEAGKIRSAETADRDGGLAAAEILTWKNLRVELIRSPAIAGGSLDVLIDRFCREVEGFIATSVVRRKNGSQVGGRSADPLIDSAIRRRWLRERRREPLRGDRKARCRRGLGGDRGHPDHHRQHLSAHPPARRPALSLAGGVERIEPCSLPPADAQLPGDIAERARGSRRKIGAAAIELRR